MQALQMNATPRILAILFCSACALHFLSPAAAQTWEERYSQWPEETTINGTIIAHNDFKNVDAIENWLSRAVTAKDARLFHCNSTAEAEAEPGVFEERLEALIGGNASQAKSQPLNPPSLQTALAEADIIAISCRNGEAPKLQDHVSELKSFLGRGGIFIVDEQVARHLGRYCLESSDDFSRDEPSSGTASDSASTDAPTAPLTTGLNLLPDCILHCSARGDDASDARLLSALANSARTVGLSIDPNTMLVLSGRKVTCFGEGSVSVCLPETARDKAKKQTITQIESRSRFSARGILDLTQWRREAIDRTLEPFPRLNPPEPRVENGTLLIVGGGGMPEGLMDRFVELAGGPEHAKLVYVPCSESEQVSPVQSTVRLWKRMGVQHATFIHTKARSVANNDPEFLEPLKEATGIWFGGGRQWNFADSYYGTTAHKLMLQVLERGGVVGGSSAGASIQAEFLARATPIGNTRILAPGYERGGLGFISGVAIDQHFTQRGRQKDMRQLKARYPQLLGIGIDEATAIEVAGSKATVVGAGDVYFYGRDEDSDPTGPEYAALPAGSIYDLVDREVILDASDTKAAD